MNTSIDNRLDSGDSMPISRTKPDERPRQIGILSPEIERSVSAWIRSAYWQEFSKLWQALNRFVESGHSDGPGASTAVETCAETLRDYETEFKRGLRDRLLESSLLTLK